MYPTDPIKTKNHIRLMNELKSLYMQAVIEADLKKALKVRFLNVLNRVGLLQTVAIQSIRSESDYFSTHKIAVYTSIMGAYDDLREPVFVPDNCDFYVFTDQAVPPDSVWQKMDLSILPDEIKNSNILINRYVKMFPHLFFQNYEFTIYLDGKYQVRTDLTEFIQQIGPHGLKMFFHPLRTCAYQEIKTCIRLGKGKKEELQAYALRLKAAGMPVNYGMLEGGIIIRETQNETCQQIMNSWWKEFSQFAKRDQISLPFILWQRDISTNTVAIQNRSIWSDPAIRKYPHKNK